MESLGLQFGNALFELLDPVQQHPLSLGQPWSRCFRLRRNSFGRWDVPVFLIVCYQRQRNRENTKQ